VELVILILSRRSKGKLAHQWVKGMFLNLNAVFSYHATRQMTCEFVHRH